MSQVVVQRDGAVAILRLNRPEAMNALSMEMRAGLEEAVPALLGDPGVRCLVLTGTGKAFCAGGDVRTMHEQGPNDVRQRLQRLHAWLRLLLSAQKPIVTAVNGHAVGAGLSLALVGDVIFSVPEAKFRSGFPGIGAVPDLGCAYLLPRRIGMGRAREILLTDRTLTAAEAESIGLVNYVVPQEELMERALAAAQRLAAGPTVSLGLAKTLLQRAFESTLDEVLEAEAFAQAIAFSTHDFREGTAAFREKRPPRFEGR